MATPQEPRIPTVKNDDAAIFSRTSANCMNMAGHARDAIRVSHTENDNYEKRAWEFSDVYDRAVDLA